MKISPNEDPAESARDARTKARPSLPARQTLLQAYGDEIADALDWLPVGIVLVDAEGEVLFFNQSAGETIRSSGALSICHGRLRASTPGETAALHELIAQSARKTAGQHQGGRCSAMPISRPSMSRPISVTVAPLRHGGGKQGARRAAVAVFMSDPERDLTTPHDHLVTLYGLTQAEAMIVLALLHGQSLECVAKEASISINTAKTHLKHVFQKTRTNRQAELIRLVFRSSAMLRYEWP